MRHYYWIENVFGNLYAVKHDNGGFSITDFEGSYDECQTWIENKQ